MIETRQHTPAWFYHNLICCMMIEWQCYMYSIKVLSNCIKIHAYMQLRIIYIIKINLININFFSQSKLLAKVYSFLTKSEISAQNCDESLWCLWWQSLGFKVIHLLGVFFALKWLKILISFWIIISLQYLIWQFSTNYKIFIKGTSKIFLYKS